MNHLFVLHTGVYFFVCVGLGVARQMEMPTLIPDTPPNCLVNDPMLLHIREPSRKMVLRAAQFVVGISSSIGIITYCLFYF
jgi:hypothetical protein